MCEIDTSYGSAFIREGYPLRGQVPAKFRLQSVLQEISVSQDRYISKKAQLEHFKIAVEDDPGWFMVLHSNEYLSHAKHIALNVAFSYARDDLTTAWVTSFNWSTKKNANLYVLDAYFEDDLPTRRSMIYEYLCSLNNPYASVILLTRGQSINNCIKNIGIKPHLYLSIAR